MNCGLLFDQIAYAGSSRHELKPLMRRSMRCAETNVGLYKPTAQYLGFPQWGTESLVPPEAETFVK